MPTKTLFGIWAFFDICLLVAGAICISMSVIWRSPSLLRSLILTSEDLNGKSYMTEN